MRILFLKFFLTGLLLNQEADEKSKIVVTL